MKKILFILAMGLMATTANAQLPKQIDSVFVKVRNIVTIGTKEEIKAEVQKRQFHKANYELLGYEFIKLMQNPKDKPEGLYLLFISRKSIVTPQKKY